jgi:aspartyl-tRNA(Asn)/glutamyl-tRNA(Gln) amidotransferase subunit A
MRIDLLLSGGLSGKPLALAARALREPRLAALGAQVMRHELGISALRPLLSGRETLEPNILPRAGRPPRAHSSIANAPESAPWLASSDRLTTAYRAGRFTPEELLQRLLGEAERLAERQPWLRCLWLRDDAGARSAARASSERYARGEPRGPLDGVPVVIKEQLAIAGMPRRLGHDLPADAIMESDAVVTARLRAEGAIIVAQTAMTELGLSPIGINPKRPPLRNPHHVERVAGGSSTGAAIAVSVGLVPLAVTADGGGSTRIPAALCGVFGLKPSFGRVSRTGDGFSGSLNVLGPIGTSSRDCALFLDAVSGPDPTDPLTLHAPPPRAPFASALTRGVRGLRIGVDEREWSEADPAVQRAGQHALKLLSDSGVELVDISIALAPYAVSMGALTIAAEVHGLMQTLFAQKRDAFGLDIQVLMHIAGQLQAGEYLAAQSLRERLRREVAAVFMNVDAIALPSTRRTAPPVSESDERTGRVDAVTVRALCRYSFLANLTGLPAVTAPIGLDAEGLPIGLQLVGDAWDEYTLLALLAELERIGVGHAARPPYHVDLMT